MWCCSLESLTLERTTQLLQIILDNHRKEEQIRLTNERYTYINLASNESIYDWDILNDELTWGESYYRLYASEEEQNDTRPPVRQWSNHLHTDQQNDVLKDLQKALEDPEQTVWRASYRFRKKNGQYAYIEEQGYIVRDSLGQAIRMIGAMRDITEKSELERLLNRTHQLARIGSWEVDLINDSVYISDSAREMFSIDSREEITLENALSYYVESERTKLDLAFARCIRNGSPFDLQVKALLPGGAERWIRVLGEADRVDHRTIQRQFDCDPVTLAIHQAIPCSLIVNEVMTNVIKHAFPNGAGRSPAATETPTVDVALKEEGTDVILEITDNGIGIPDEICPEEEETLGIKLIHQLTWQLDGSCELRSQPATNSGTRFRLAFKRARAQHPTERPSWP